MAWAKDSGGIRDDGTVRLTMSKTRVQNLHVGHPLMTSSGEFKNPHP
jgi:hypothetical protein